MSLEDADRVREESDAAGTSGPPSGVHHSPYTWHTFLVDHGYADAADRLYDGIGSAAAVPVTAVTATLDGETLKPRWVDDGEGGLRRAGPADDPAEEPGDDPMEGPVIGPGDVVVSGRAVVGHGRTPDGGRIGADGPVVVAGSAVGTQPARAPTAAEWARIDLDPAEFLGFHPAETPIRVHAADRVATELFARCHERYDQYEVPVLNGYYTWDDYKREFFLDEEGNPPTDEEEEPIAFTHEHKVDALGFDPDEMDERLADGGDAARAIEALIDERTVDVDPDLDEDAFFSTPDGETTITNRYDLEKAVPMAKKSHFREIERYWVNEPFSFVIIFHSTKENERKYYAVQPHLTRIETDLQEFLTGKLRTSIKYADESIAGGEEAFREQVIVEETRRLLARYDLYEEGPDRGLANEILDRLGGPGALEERFGVDPTAGRLGRVVDALGYREPRKPTAGLSGIAARPEPAVLAEDAETLTEYQVEKLLYYLTRDFIGYERIDPIKHDINVEDISCDGYNSPVFVYHSEYEQVISNVHHGTDELDDFVVKLAQRSGKGISKRRPQVDATLPDGSRAQLTLGREVSDHGTNYTIRQFNDVPYTPVDLVNWRTFSLDEMAFLWLCIENHKSLIFAGGTASGKTTSLNAVSLFIPSNAKIVSIEDTREVELPQRNWIASVTRPSFSDDDKGDVDEFDLLEAALRQRPDYIVMGEIRGEEGRTAFQVMSTGHTTYTTFHADSVGEVLKRFTTDPINVSKTMFTALDLVSVQSSTRVQGRKVRRNKSITEINHYDAENDEINVQDVYQWQAETDEFLKMGDSNTLEEIMFDRGWSRETLDDELRKRRVVLAYLIDRGLNTYAEVAATFQAFINDPETILTLMANDELERSLADLRQMESVLINVDPEKEALVPRPDPDEAGREEAAGILREAEDLFERYRGDASYSVTDALRGVTPEPSVEATPDDDHTSLAAAVREAEALDPELTAVEGIGSDSLDLDSDEDRSDFEDNGDRFGLDDDEFSVDAIDAEGVDVLDPGPNAATADQSDDDTETVTSGPTGTDISSTPLTRSASPPQGGQSAESPDPANGSSESADDSPEQAETAESEAPEDGGHNDEEGKREADAEDTDDPIEKWNFGEHDDDEGE